MFTEIGIVLGQTFISSCFLQYFVSWFEQTMLKAFFWVKKNWVEKQLGVKQFCRKFFLVRKFFVGHFFWVRKQFCRLLLFSAYCWLEQQQHRVWPGWWWVVVGGGLETHNVVKPTFTWLWSSWVLTILIHLEDFVCLFGKSLTI